MSLLTVARKDFKDTRRTRTLWLVVGLLAVLGALMGYVFGDVSPAIGGENWYKQTFVGIVRVTSIILPIVALIATYLAIAGERDSGSIKFMLSLPNTRFEVFAGKLLSRGLTVALAVAITFGVAGSLLAIRAGEVDIVFLVASTGVMALYALTFVSIAIAMSAAVASRSRAIAGAVASYFVLVVFYIFPIASITDVVSWINEALLGQGTNWDLYNFAEYTSPFIAFQKTLNFVLPEQLQSQPLIQSRLFALRGSDDASREAIRQAAQLTESDLPVYLQNEFSLIVLGFWIVAPLALGYWRFQRADLG